MTLWENVGLKVSRLLANFESGPHQIRSPEKLNKEVETVARKYGRGPGVLVEPDLVLKTLRRYLDGGLEVLRGGDLFALAHGLTIPVPILQRKTLIERPEMLSPLLGRWESEVQSGKLRPSVWIGLFQAYLQIPSGELAERFRQLLNSSWAHVRVFYSAPPLWITAVDRHKHLLEPKPCRLYVSELMSGRKALLDDLLREFKPSSLSWFWHSLIDAVLPKVSLLTADELAQQLPMLLTLTDDINLQIYRDPLLAAVLDRYAEVDGERNEILLERALLAWKSPQLIQRIPDLWANVRPSTKQMVSAWLAQEDLEDFYRLCQEDGQVDERRLVYWLRFKGQISFSQIILGGDMANSRIRNVVDFRKRKLDRIGELTSGPSDNNVILMRIGDYLFVESSAKGNACYAYRAEEAPFKSGRKYYDLKKLKSIDHAAQRLLHNVATETWEVRFDRVLKNWGIIADTTSIIRAAAKTARRKSISTAADTPSAQPSPDEVVSVTNSRAQAPNAAIPPYESVRTVMPQHVYNLILKSGAEIDDRRFDGGHCWVTSVGSLSQLAGALYGCGFQWNAKGWWKS